MSEIKGKMNWAAVRQQSPEGWVVMGWNVLAGLFVLATIVWVALGFFQNKPSETAVRKPLVYTVANVTDSSIHQPWVAFDAYEPYFANRDLFVSQEEQAAAATLVPADPVVAPVIQWGVGYQLAGVIVDEHPSAIIKTASPPGVVTVVVGASLEGAVLKNVEEGKAVFEYQGQMVTLSLAETSPTPGVRN